MIAEEAAPKTPAVKKAKDEKKSATTMSKDKQDDQKPERKLKPKVADKSPEWNDPVLW